MGQNSQDVQDGQTLDPNGPNDRTEYFYQKEVESESKSEPTPPTEADMPEGSGEDAE